MVKFSYQLPLSYDTYARWTALHWQINLTCDDMNIIQVDSRFVALSTAPQDLEFCNQLQHRYLESNIGVNFCVHDFPTSQFALKLAI